MRGNVDTRLGKLARGECEALVLAVAGLARLGRRDEAQGLLEALVPAAGQGALAVEARTGRLPASALEALSDPEATVCLTAEREVVGSLGASCRTPLGVHARAVGAASEPAAAELELSAWLGLPDGSHWIFDRLTGQAGTVAAQLVERLLSVGAAELLRAAERSA